MGQNNQKSQGGEKYLRMYPKFEKWINQCVLCQRRGYKPELPVQIGIGVGAQNIRRYFKELKLNETGFCEDCNEILKKSSKVND